MSSSQHCDEREHSPPRGLHYSSTERTESIRGRGYNLNGSDSTTPPGRPAESRGLSPHDSAEIR